MGEARGIALETKLHTTMNEHLFGTNEDTINTKIH